MAKKVIRFFGPDGEDREIPAKFVVCPRCGGEGTHVNPSIDEYGIPAEDFDADPDFAEAYFSGLYDVPCYDCKGAKVVLAPDEGHADPRDLEDYEKDLLSKQEIDAILESERRFGA